MDLLLVTHIIAGATGLASGGTALVARKGGRLHRLAGTLFLASMLYMTVSGGAIAARTNHRITILAASLTFYLVTSGWLTVRPVGGKRMSLLMLACGTVIAAFGFFCGLESMSGRGDVLDDGFIVPPAIYFTFASFAALGVIGDIWALARGTRGRWRIMRHLWRMCVPLYIAASSFFVGQEDVFPKELQGTFILKLPQMAVIVLLVFWLGFVAISKRYGPRHAASNPELRKPARV